MQVTPVDYYPQPPLSSTSINRLQQLTPANSVTDDDFCSTNRVYNRGRSVSDTRDDDYYFYHSGRRGMTSRRGSVQSIGRRPEDDANPPEPVRLPPITSLLAAVERSFPTAKSPDVVPPPPPPPQQYLTPREPPTSHYPPRDPYYSPPTSYPHMPYRRQSIFSTYSSSTSSPPIPSYPPSSHHNAYPQQLTHPGITPYRTPSPPYQRSVPLPQTYPTQHIQPRPPPSFIPPGSSSHRTSAFAINHRTHSASPSERYMCHECQKSFSRPSSLRIHTFSHTGEKPFVCPEPGCTKRFSVRSNMRRHMKVHQEQQSASGTPAPEPREGGTTADEIKEEDGVSETSTTSPGHVSRPRQGSRSSI